MMLKIPPFAAIFLAGLLHSIRTKRTIQHKWTPWILLRLVISAILLALPPHSWASAWRPLTFMLSQWYKIIPNAPTFLVQGGPFGKGCAKILEVVAAYILYTLSRGEAPPISLGPLPEWWVLLIVLGLSIINNAVLLLWSRLSQSRGDHEGVNAMVQDSMGRKLSLREHGRLAILAILNATCEEVSSRGFWRNEFSRTGLNEWQSNFAQATIFGIWHYHGIPSGFVGVGLTFLYGLIMGFLADYGHGLLLPIMTHSIADYYIFVIIARKQQKGGAAPIKKAA